MDIIEQIDDEWAGDWLGVLETEPAADPAPAPDPPDPVVAAPTVEPEASPFLAWTAAHTPELTLVARRSDSGRWLDAHVFVILAVAISLPAVAMPAAWLAVCAIGALVML